MQLTIDLGTSAGKVAQVCTTRPAETIAFAFGSRALVRFPAVRSRPHLPCIPPLAVLIHSIRSPSNPLISHTPALFRSSLHNPVMPSKISVTIVGGGIGGLALANMFEKAGIEYVVLEKAASVKALGSSLGLDASSLPVMEQLGLLEEFQRVSKPVRQFNFYNEAIEPIGLVDFACMTEM